MQVGEEDIQQKRVSDWLHLTALGRYLALQGAQNTLEHELYKKLQRPACLELKLTYSPVHFHLKMWLQMFIENEYK